MNSNYLLNMLYLIFMEVSHTILVGFIHKIHLWHIVMIIAIHLHQVD